MVIPSIDPLEPKAALEYWRSKVALTEPEWDALITQSNETAFRLAGIADIDVVEHVWAALDDALERGDDFKDFKLKIGEQLEEAWAGSVANPGWRIETIFRTNCQQSYQAGHYKQAQENRKDRPYGIFDVVDDDALSDICGDINDQLGGQAIPLDDPIWDKIWPENHFNCRSTVITLTEEEAIEEGLLDDIPDPDDLDVDDGFDHAPGEDGEPDAEEYPEELMDDVRRFLEEE